MMIYFYQSDSFILISLLAVGDTTVLVIGAGISGLSASQTLLEGGVKKVTVLEASNRIGGRVWSVPFHGHMVELGAHWIQGKGENPIWKLAQKLKLAGTWSVFIVSGQLFFVEMTVVEIQEESKD